MYWTTLSRTVLRRSLCLALGLVGFLVGFRVPGAESDPTIDGTWVELPPPLRSTPILGYDSNRLIVAGGTEPSNSRSRVTWAFDLGLSAIWSRLETSGDYDGSAGQGFVDLARHRLVVTDGVTAWVLDLALRRWTRHAVPTTGFGPVGLAFDPTRNRILLVGGAYLCGSLHPPQTCYVGGVWSWPVDGDSALVEISSPDSAPRNRSDHSAMFDPSRDRLIAFGDRFDRMYTLAFSDAPQWDSIAVTGETPIATSARSSFYDPIGDLLVSYGGRRDVRTLSLGTDPHWTLLPTPDPVPDADGSVTYDPEHRRILLAAGANGSFWSYSLETGSWTRLSQPGPLLTFHSMILDSPANRLVVFGGLWLGSPFGSEEHRYNDVWSYPLDGTGAWTLLQPQETPPAARDWATAVFDPSNDQMVVFAGEVGDHDVNDTWTLSLGATPTWRELTFADPIPPPEAAAAAVYDPVGQRIILCVGSTPSGSPTEVAWSLDLNPSPRWQVLTVLGTPPNAMGAPGVAYDSRRQRVILVDAQDFTAWALNLAGTPSWERIATSAMPASSGLLQCAYDPVQDRLIADVYTVGVFQLSLASSPAQWARLTPSGSPPPQSNFYPVVLDPARNRLLEFGGQIGSGYTNGVFSLQWEPIDHPTPVIISVVSAEVVQGLARIIWQTSSAAARFTVERSEASGAWQTSAVVEQDGLGRITFEDPDVRAGERYGYRVADGSSSLATASEVWLDIPANRELSLAAPAPNPVTRVFFTQVSLPRRSQGLVEVIGVDGRLLASQSLSTLAPGTHLLRFDVRSVPAGLYFIRLRDAEHTIVRRFSIVR
jgi:hypothetical protein